MRRFAKAPCAILSNARCLTEGIDVPSVDMVCFMEPKESEIDIVQAIGRALRTNDNKQTGYIFVPLFLDQRARETVGEALRRSRYETIWEVLRAIYSFDEELQQQMALWRQDFGYRGSLEFPPLMDSFNFISSPRINLADLKNSISVFIAEELSNIWDEHYGQLRAFYDTHGHIEVPSGNWLRGWIKTQRRFWNSRLTPQQRTLLLGLGFDPNPLKTIPLRHLETLKKYTEQHGHCNLTSKGNDTLFRWLAEQRRLYHAGQLTPHLIEELERLNIIWGDAFARLFQDTLCRFQAYRAKHGKTFVANTRKSDDRLLSSRVTLLRSAYRKGELNEEQIKACAQVELELSPKEAHWQERFEELRAYVEQGKDPNQIPNNQPLRRWVRSMRQGVEQGILPREKRARLEALGVSWEKPSLPGREWSLRFSEVWDYLKKHKLNILPSDHPRYHWWKVQLRQFENRKLTPDKTNQMLALNPKRGGRRWGTREKQIIKANRLLPLKELEKLLPGRKAAGIQKIRDRYGW